MGKIITYPELSCLSSDTNLVLNDYHGDYQITDKNYRTITYTCFGEVLNKKQIYKILEDFPDSYVILITARQYLDFPHQSNRYQILTMPNAYGWYATKMIKSSYKIGSMPFKKRFLSLNNRAQWNRQALAQLLIKFNLLDQFYFSYWCQDRWKVGQRILFDQINGIIGNTWFNQGLDQEEFFQMLPISTNLDNFLETTEPEFWSEGRDTYYHTTFCNVSNETYIDENHDPFFTEKVMKSLAYGQAFLLFSSSGALKLLQNLGFKTFPDFFDESYDEIDSAQLRCEVIFREILRLSKLSDQEINRMHQAMIPRLQHNQDFFWEEWPKIYQRDIVDIKDRVSDIISKI